MNAPRRESLRRSLRSVRKSLARRLRRADRDHGEEAHANSQKHSVLCAAMTVETLQEIREDVLSDENISLSVDAAVDCIDFACVQFLPDDAQAVQVLHARTMPLGELADVLGQALAPDASIVVCDFWSRHSAAFKPKATQPVTLIFRDWHDAAPLLDSRVLRRLLRVPAAAEMSILYGAETVEDAFRQGDGEKVVAAAQTLRDAIWHRRGQSRPLAVEQRQKILERLGQILKTCIISYVENVHSILDMTPLVAVSVLSAAGRALAVLGFASDAQKYHLQAVEQCKTLIADSIDVKGKVQLAQATASFGSSCADAWDKSETTSKFTSAIDILTELVKSSTLGEGEDEDEDDNDEDHDEDHDEDDDDGDDEDEDKDENEDEDETEDNDEDEDEGDDGDEDEKEHEDRSDAPLPELLAQRASCQLEAARAARRVGAAFENLAWAQGAVQDCEAAYGPLDAQSHAARFELGRAQLFMGQFDASLATLWELEQDLKSGLEPEEHMIGETLLELAKVYRQLSRHDEAEHLIDRVLLSIPSTEDEVFVVHRQGELLAARALVELCGLAREKGRYILAGEIAQECLARYDQLLAPDSPLRVAVLDAYVRAKRVLFKHTEAYALAEANRKSIQNTMGYAHPDGFSFWSGFGELMCRREINCRVEGLNMLHQVLEHAKAALPAEHFQVASLAASLAVKSANRVDLEAALSKLERVYGKKHLRVAGYMADVANMKKPQESLDMSLEALGIFERWFPGADYHPSMGVILFNVAHRYDTLGRYEEAINCMKRTAVIFANGYPPDHPNVGRCIKFALALETRASETPAPSTRSSRFHYFRR